MRTLPITACMLFCCLVQQLSGGSFQLELGPAVEVVTVETPAGAHLQLSADEPQQLSILLGLQQLDLSQYLEPGRDYELVLSLLVVDTSGAQSTFPLTINAQVPVTASTQAVPEPGSAYPFVIGAAALAFSFLVRKH